MKLLPFCFDRLSSGDYFISNLAGFHDYLSESSFLSLLENSKPESSNEQDRLLRKLFIAEDGQLDTSVALLSAALGKKLASELTFSPTFMIVPTLRCDHTCTYCQVSRAPLNAHNVDLDKKHIRSIIKTIETLASPPYKLEIQGGEPLLRYEFIQEVYEEAERVLGQGMFELVITTSLSLLRDDMLEWAAPRKIFFSTSLDGDEVVHNLNRILPHGNSYKAVESSVKRINAFLGPGRVAAVTTVTKALIERPEALIEAHLDIGLNEMFVRPISPYGFAKSSNNETYSISEYLEFYKKLFSLIREYNSRGQYLIEHSAAIHVKRILNPGYSQYADLKSPSGYIFNSILFNYDGKVYGSDEARMLQRVLGKLDLSCGSISGVDLASALNKSIISNSFNFLHPGCAECAYQPYCGTDPCQSISNDGEPIGDKSSSLFCQYHMGMFRFFVEELRTNSESASMLIGWVND